MYHTDIAFVCYTPLRIVLALLRYVLYHFVAVDSFTYEKRVQK